MTDPTIIMKQQVGRAAAEYIKSNSIIGLGTGSTTAYAIEHIGKRLESGSLENIIGITTSFQAEVLAKKYNIPLSTLDMVDRIDIAIDGADEVDPKKNLIKGGGAAHTQEKIVDSLAKKFIVVVDGNKIVDALGSTVPVPVEVIPKALSPVMKKLEELGGITDLRMGVRKAGPVVTDQGNLIIDTKFDYINDPKSLETIINNIPGVLDNGLFIGVADLVLIGEIVENTSIVREF